MKSLRWVLVFTVAALLSAAAQADHRHRSRWSVSIGVPLVWQFGTYPRYAPYPYYGYPYPYSYYQPQPVIVVPPAPVYVEQPSPRPPVASRLPSGYWYYCASARAYYPYVSECPEAWQPVPPTPAEPAR